MRGTEIGYVEVQNMLEELRRQHTTLRQNFDDSQIGGGEPEPLSGRRDWIIPQVFFSTGSEPTIALAIVANRVSCILFYIDRAFQVSTIAYDVSASAAGGTAVFALYDQGGALLSQWALPTTGTGAKLSGALDPPINLVPGYYWLAWSCDLTAVLTFGLGSGGVAQRWATVLNGGATRIGTSPNPMAAFVMPDSLGDVIADITVAPPIVCISSEVG